VPSSPSTRLAAWRKRREQLAATTRGSSQHRRRSPPPFMPLPSPHITPAPRHNPIHAVEQRTSRLSLRTSIAPIPPRHLTPGANLHCQNRAAAEPHARSRGVRAWPRASNPPCFLPRSMQWGYQFSLVDPGRRPDSASAPHRGRAHLAVRCKAAPRHCNRRLWCSCRYAPPIRPWRARMRFFAMSQSAGRGSWVVLWELCTHLGTCIRVLLPAHTRVLTT
jgi:hypothetical protein